MMERIYVGNLPYVAQLEDVQKLFKENDVSVSNIDFSTDPFTGRNPSYCFADLATEDAELALEVLQGQNVRGRPVKIGLNTRTSFKGFSALREDSHRGCNASDESPAETKKSAFVFNRWTRDDAKDHWTLPVDEGRRLYVGGMPNCTSAGLLNMEMRRLFRGYDLQAVSKIISPHDWEEDMSCHRFYCFVDLASPEQARQAVRSLDGVATPYGGQYEVSVPITHPSKILREQLGGVWPTEAQPRERNLDGDWRATARAVS